MRAKGEPDPREAHTPPQFFVEPGMVVGGQIILTGELHRHARAQRLSHGETLRAVQGETVYTARVVQVLADRLVASILERATAEEPEVCLHLYASLLKGQSFDLVVEKATELGVSRIIPVLTRRTIVRLDAPKSRERRMRWEKIAVAAAQQSGRCRVPSIGEVASFDDLMARAAKETATEAAGATRAPRVHGAAAGFGFAGSGTAGSGTAGASAVHGVAADSGAAGSGTAGASGAPDAHGATHSWPVPERRLLGYEHGSMTVSLAQALSGATEAAVLIGPEGGLEACEIEEALKQGFVPVSLGPHILKAETASIAAVALVMHHLTCQRVD